MQNECSNMFFKVPKELFTDKKYSQISFEAKILYSMMLDKADLSRKNGWCDENGRFYIYFSQNSAEVLTGYSHNKVLKLYSMLDDKKGIGLITRKKQGLGKPDIIFINNAEDISFEETEEKTSDKGDKFFYPIQNKDNSISKNRGSRTPKLGGQEVAKKVCSNTEFNNTELIKTEVNNHSIECEKEKNDEIQYSENYVKDFLEYDALICDNPFDKRTIDGIIDLVTEIISSTLPKIRIGGELFASNIVKSRFLKLEKEHIEYVMMSLEKNTKQIKNIKSYLLTSLYNAPATMNSFYKSMVNVTS